MTTAEFKKIARLLKEAYKELEDEALKSGVSLLSKEYDEMQARVREVVLESQGFTLEEYRSAKAKVAGFSQADLVDETEKIDDKVSKKVSESIISLEERIEQLERAYVPTAEDIEDISNRVAKKYIKPPQITNQIIERIKEPKIIKETVKVKEEYNDKPLRKELESISSKVKDLPDLKTLHEEFIKPVQNLKESIEIEWGSVMPDFRKMGMGLDSRIAALEAGGGGGDGTWGSITGTLSNQTDLQTALDAKQNTITGLTASGAELNILDGATLTTTELNYVDGVTSAIQTQLDGKADKSGALTQFVGNTAWRVFYSDANGDITELALGADGTFLKSNGASAAPTFATPAGTGDVSKVGTPVDNQIGVWTGDGTIEGDASLTWDGTSFNIATAKNFQIAGSTILADSAGTTTLSNIDAIDATTEATIEAAIDTLANLTSIQGRTVTLADAGANAFFGWDDTAGAYENLTQAEAFAILGITSSASELNILDGATLTVTELNYVDGVTSAIQTQLDAKSNLAGGNAFTGVQTFADEIRLGGLADQGAFEFQLGGKQIVVPDADTDTAFLMNNAANTKNVHYLRGDGNVVLSANVGGTVGIGAAASGAKFMVSGDATNPAGAFFRPGADTSAGFGVNNAADSLNRHLFYGNGNAKIAMNASAVAAFDIVTDTSVTLNVDTFVSGTSTATLTDITQSVSGNNFSFFSGYAVDRYLPGFIWYNTDNNATKPKAGIFSQVTNSGSILYLGTSNNYATGIVNTIELDYSANLSPSTSDVGALGTSTKMWADLFLASGSVINFNNGDVTLTHGLNNLTLNGGNLYIATGGSYIIAPSANDGASLGSTALSWSDAYLASGGVINWDNGNATLTHSAGLLTSNVPISLGTSNALTAGSIELGHASDTTLSRVSAGVVAIEGVNILTTAGGTLTGNITLGENTSIDLDPAGSADGKYSGICITGTAGAALAFGDLIYLAAADSRWELADADAASTADRMLGICVLAAAGDGSATKILLHGNIRADAAFPALTIGSPVYVGETAGDVQTAIPTGADNVIRRVGYALTADELYFCPSMDSQISVA